MSTPALRVWLTRYRQQQQLAQLQSLTAAAVAEGERVKALRAASAAVEIAHKHDVPEETPPIAAELQNGLPPKLSPSRQKHPVTLRTGRVPR